MNFFVTRFLIILSNFLNFTYQVSTYLSRTFKENKWVSSCLLNMISWEKIRTLRQKKQVVNAVFFQCIVDEVQAKLWNVSQSLIVLFVYALFETCLDS